MIVVVNIGGANLASITNALDRLGKKWQLTADPDLISRSPHVILPGVGAAGKSMERLRAGGLPDCIRELKNPTLGICLGMQLLFTDSKEGNARCLDIIPGSVAPLVRKKDLTIPHMGWNSVRATENPTRLLMNIPDGSYFYFVHSYRAPDGPWVRGVTEHGDEFPSIVESDNFFGTQFHPERSAEAGEQLIRNFLRL